MLATSGARPVELSVSSLMSNYRRMYPGAGVIVHDAMAWREDSSADVLKQTRVISGYQANSHSTTAKPRPPSSSCPPLNESSNTQSSFKYRTRLSTTTPSSTKRYLIPSRRTTTSLTFSQLTKYPVLNTLEQRTQVPKTYAVLGGLVFVVFLHTFNALAAPISNLVGWGLPAYLSFKAIETPSPHDDVQWLTYWVVFGFFNFLESFALRIVLYYVPWYFAFKSLFIVWLQLPAFRVCRSLNFFFSSVVPRPL
jgi:hypothetical protein